MSASAASPRGTVQIPSTPPPVENQSASSNAPSNERSRASPQALSSSMTPPPSTQLMRQLSPVARPDSKVADPSLASPPNTVRMNITTSLPSIDKITSASIEELRTIAQDLVNALTEARMSAAHFKLQHNLLSMETQEAAQRAEVEQQMTRREVEVLHAADQRHRAAASTPRVSNQPSPQPQIIALTKTCKDLEDERNEIEDRFQEIKKVLELERDRAELLAEENLLLKKRIRENREHFTKLKESPIYSTPRQAFTTPRRKSYSRFTAETPTHEPFAALLYADQMLSQETASVPSTPTPTKTHTARLKQGHNRGAHSLSSLQTTPAKRPTTSDGFPDSHAYGSMPNSQVIGSSAERDRHDRDSTISISDVEEGSGDDIPQSQASSLATDMLRKQPASQETIRHSQDAERSSNLLQTKLFGTVKKTGTTTSKGKRSADQAFEESVSTKKAKLDRPVGLGVGLEQWNRASS